MADSEIPRGAIEIIRGQLYFISQDPPASLPPRSIRSVLFANDPSFTYTSYFADFGPLDLGITYQFCVNLHETMQRAKEPRKQVLFYAGSHEHKRANSAACLCAYLVFVLDFSAERAYSPFIGLTPPFIPFRDAGFCINTFPLTVLDVTRACRKAKDAGHFDFSTFSLTSYQHMAKLQHGDMSWVVPGKFIAFSGPQAKRRQLASGLYTLTPEQYVPLFKSLGVTCIVRFNEKVYDRRDFLNHGLRHVDLFYEDGGNPTDAILQSFLQLCEQERGAVAVHCKAGLGRTGTNIAAYMIKHFGYTAKESMAWLRLCRPGCVVGPQQQYLMVTEARLAREGEDHRRRLQLQKQMSTQPSTQYRRKRSNSNVSTCSASSATSQPEPTKPQQQQTTSTEGGARVGNGHSSHPSDAQSTENDAHYQLIHTGLQQVLSAERKVQSPANRPGGPPLRKKSFGADAAATTATTAAVDVSALSLNDNGAARSHLNGDSDRPRTSDGRGNTSSQSRLAALTAAYSPQTATAAGAGDVSWDMAKSARSTAGAAGRRAQTAAHSDSRGSLVSQSLPHGLRHAEDSSNGHSTPSSSAAPTRPSSRHGTQQVTQQMTADASQSSLKSAEHREAWSQPPQSLFAQAAAVTTPRKKLPSPTVSAGSRTPVMPALAAQTQTQTQTQGVPRPRSSNGLPFTARVKADATDAAAMRASVQLQSPGHTQTQAQGVSDGLQKKRAMPPLSVRG